MLKRCVDIVVASLLLVVALPAILVLAVVLAVELRTSPFFVQERIGRGGRRFRFLKLRTLPPTTPRYALKEDLDDASLSPLRAFLRERHLDELPQLVHVVAGQLSLVGPRPRMPDEFEPVDPEYARWRVRVPQGCTGLWQIGAHTDLLPDEHPEYDLFYVRHGSLALDAWILWRTVLQVAGIGAPVTIEDVPAFLYRGPTELDAVIDLTGDAEPHAVDPPSATDVPHPSTVA